MERIVTINLEQLKKLLRFEWESGLANSGTLSEKINENLLIEQIYAHEGEICDNQGENE